MGRSYTKAVERAEKKDRRPMAKAKYVRISPYKVRAVLDDIRGKSYREAVAILENLNKSSSDPVLKVVKSAGANAENNLGMSTDMLYVAECYADPTKASELLGWTAQKNLLDMCKDSWRFTKNNL